MKQKIYNKKGFIPTPKFGASLRSKRGFTLVEMLVVIFIVGLVSSILIVNWRRNESQYKVQRAAQEIAQNIRKAQDMALNSFKKEGINVPYNYGVHFEKQQTNSYKIFADINNNGRYDGGEILETINLESGTQIGSLSANPKLDILFSLPDGFTIIYPSAILATITVRNSDGTRYKDVKIRISGQVNVE